MNHELHHLAEAYAIGALPDDEHARFEEHLHSCPVCQDEVAAAVETTVTLAEGVASPPPDPLRSKVLAAIAHQPQERRSPGADRHAPRMEGPAKSRRLRPIRPTTVIGVAAAAAVLFVVGMVAVGPGGDDTRTVEDLVATADVISTELTDESGAVVEVLWSDLTDEVALLADDLPDPGPGMAYQLWFLVDDQPIPATVFRPVDGEVSTLSVEDDLRPDAWAITIEPETGSAEPTLPILFVGAV